MDVAFSDLINFTYLSLFIIVATLFLQYLKYGVKFILHPTFWFFLVWIFSIISFLIYIEIGFTFIIIYPDLIKELFVYIDFTCICVAILGWRKAGKINQNLVQFNLTINEKLIKYISLLIFIVVLVNTFQSSNDIVANREMGAELMKKRTDQVGKTGLMFVLKNVALNMNLPLLVYTSYHIIKKYVTKSEIKLGYYYYLPLISMILTTVINGGRAGIISAAILFSQGTFIALFSDLLAIRPKFKKLLIPIVVFAISFTLYSTLINQLRSEKTEVDHTTEKWEEFPILKPFSGIIQYLTDHYPGYQLRRVDSVTPEEDYFGKTFTFVKNASIPFITQFFGTSISLESIFHLGRNDVAKVDLSDLEWSNTTATVYLVLYDDFGYYGTFVAIFIFALVTQFFFERFYLKNHKTYISTIFMYTMLIYLWSNSIFSHHISDNWLLTFYYYFLMVDLLNYAISDKSIKLENESTVVG